MLYVLSTMDSITIDGNVTINQKTIELLVILSVKALVNAGLDFNDFKFDCIKGADARFMSLKDGSYILIPMNEYL